MLTVFGAIHTDVSMFVDSMPGDGETVLGRDHVIAPGGKGANQALAAARAETKVAFVGMIGEDDTGRRAKTSLRRAGVMTSGVGVSDTHGTGIAFIMRGSGQAKRTIVCPGANQEAASDQVPGEILGAGYYVLMQMEVPWVENRALLKKAKANGATTILNLAPVVDLSAGMLDNVDYLVVNHVEARQLCDRLGIADNGSDVVRMACAIAGQCNCVCIVTRSEQGAIAMYSDGSGWHVDAIDLGGNEIVDVTGSGDSYTGTLAACLKNGMRLETAMHYASAAGSLTCMHNGAQEAFPYWDAIEAACKDLAPPRTITLT